MNESTRQRASPLGVKIGEYLQRGRGFIQILDRNDALARGGALVFAGSV